MGYKKIITGIFISILALFVGCGVEFPYYQTSEFSDYNKVYKSNALYYWGFPESVKEENVEKFSHVEYVYRAGWQDSFLWIKMEDDATYEEFFKQTTDSISKWKTIEVENLLLNGYTCIFIGKLKVLSDGTINESTSIEAYMRQKKDYYYGSWQMIMYSHEERSIVFNKFIYSSYAGEKNSHIPYIMEYMGVDLKQIEFEYRF